jgi:hypothetical protein
MNLSNRTWSTWVRACSGYGASARGAIHLDPNKPSCARLIACSACLYCGQLVACFTGDGATG